MDVFEKYSVLLDAPEVESRREAVLLLSGGGQQESIEPVVCVRLLVKALKDQSWRVRKTAQDILLKEYELEQYMEPLIGLLYIEDNAGARNSAIEALQKLNRRATPWLIEAFDTHNVDVRKFIIDVLGEFQDKRALKLMLGALEDEDENVRASAVEHLGSIGDSTVTPALVEILRQGELWTAFPAADALGRIGDRSALPALIEALDRKALREPVLKAIGRLASEEHLVYVIPFLDDKSKVVQEEALRTVEAMFRRGASGDALAQEVVKCYRDRAMEVLLRHTSSAKPDVRAASVLLVSLLKDERSLEPLLELSFDEEFSVEVRKALVYIGKNRPETLLPLFEKDDPYLRRFLCAAASEVASPLYYDILLSMLRDEDGHVRALSARGLARIGDSRAIPHLKVLMVEDYPDVQQAGVEAMAAFGGAIDKDELVRDLLSPDWKLRKNAALVLGLIKASSAVEAIGFSLKDENVRVRAAAVEALSNIGDSESVSYTILALTDESEDIRASAALSLGSIGGPEAFEPLVLLLNDPDDIVKVAAIKALTAYGDTEAEPHLIELFHNENGFVVTMAVAAVGSLKGEKASEAIKEMLGSRDDEIRRTALKALSGLRGVADAVLPFTRDEDWATRKAAIEALSKDMSPEAAGSLEELLDIEEDPVVIEALKEALDV